MTEDKSMSESSIPSDERQRLIAGYVLYDLGPDEYAILQQWMAEDSAIAQDIADEIEQMQQVLESVYGTPDIPPPIHLRDTILEVYRARNVSVDSTVESQAVLPNPEFISAEQTLTPVALSPVALSSVQPHTRRRWVIGLGAVAAVLIAGLSLSNILLWRSLQTTRAQLENVQPSNAQPIRTVSLTPVDAETPTAASILVQINAEDLEATLGVENLQPLSDEKVYALWTVLQPDAPFTTDPKNAILTQTFTVDETGNASTQILLPRAYQDSQWVKAIAITIEDADAPQRHESSPIFIEAL